MNKILYEIALFLAVSVIAFPMNFIFTFAWNHSLTELWPDTVPNIGYWQGYLLLLVFRFIFPPKVIATYQEK